jgi:hypothetical protein
VEPQAAIAMPLLLALSRVSLASIAPPRSRCVILPIPCSDTYLVGHPAGASSHSHGRRGSGGVTLHLSVGGDLVSKKVRRGVWVVC